MVNAIDLIDAPLLHVAASETPVAQLAQWVEPLKRGCLKYGIIGVRPIAALLSQSAHESGGFTRLSENLNYSAQRLAEVWPFRFAVDPHAKPGTRLPNATALAIGRNPELIANHVYANRLGNGPPSSGDGWRYRGEGLFQLTGHDNQDEFAHAAGIPLADVAAYSCSTEGAAMSACWFFQRHGLIDLAKTPGIRDDTEAINGGVIGLPDRQRRFDAVVAELIRRGA